MNVTAVSADNSDFQSRQSTDVPRRWGSATSTCSDRAGGERPALGGGGGAEAVGAAGRSRRYDLVLLPSHLWLTIHEAIAHPTELDRIMGYEANYAGTSFIIPSRTTSASFRYGPEFINVQGERSTPGGLSTVGYDDEGVRRSTI
jgi:TldD protein